MVNASPFKEYGQIQELSDDIDFVVTGEGGFRLLKANSGINAITKYVSENVGVKENKDNEETAKVYLTGLSKSIEDLSKMAPDAKIKLNGEFMTVKDAIKVVGNNYKEFLLKGI